MLRKRLTIHVIMGYTSISELLLIIPPAYLQDNINVMPVTHYANCKTWLNPTLTRAMIRSDTRSDWLIQIWEPLLVILDFFTKKWDFLHTCNIYFHSESLMAAV